MMYFLFIIISIVINSFVIGTCIAGIAIFVNSQVSDQELICSSIILDLAIAVGITILYQIKNLISNKARELTSEESSYYLPILQSAITEINRSSDKSLEFGKDVYIKISNKNSLGMLHHLDKTIIINQLCKQIKPSHLQKLFLHELILLQTKLKAKRLMMFASNAIAFAIRSIFIKFTKFNKRLHSPSKLLLLIFIVAFSPILLVILGWTRVVNSMLNKLDEKIIQQEITIS